MFKKKSLLTKHLTSLFPHSAFFYPLPQYTLRKNNFQKSNAQQLQKRFSTVQFSNQHEQIKAKRFDSSKSKQQTLYDLITVKTLEQVKQKPRSDSRKRFFPSFEYRAIGVQNTINTAATNLQAYKDNLENEIVKQTYAFITIVGGSGSGKTRAAKEIGNILRTSEDLDYCFKNTCEFYIDFSNGYKLQHNENMNPSCIIGLRLFHYALVDNMDFEEFMNTNAHLIKQGVFTVRNVLHEISKTYRPLLGIQNEAPLPLVIIMDEFQCTMAYKSLSENKEWKKIAKELADYMCNSNSASTTLIRDRLLLIPVVAGTFPFGDISFEMTMYANYRFPLPCFPLETALKLAKEANIPEYYLNRKDSEYKRFWYLMGLIPRCLEFACKFILESKQRNMTAEQLFDLVQREMIRLYKDMDNYSNGRDAKLLQYAMTGKLGVQTEEWIQELERQGKIFLQGEPTRQKNLLLPHPIFYNMTIAYAHMLPTSCIPTSKEMFNWYTFEKLDLHILAQRRRFATTIHELFPGAYGDESIKTLEIHTCNNIEFQVETKYYIEGTRANPIVHGTDSPIEIGRGTIKDARDTFVLQAKANQQLIDGRLFIHGCKKEQIVCFLQYKYSEEPEVDKEEQVKISPLVWYNSIAPAIKQQYKDYLIVFVYITNANIPKKAKSAIKQCQNLLVIEQSCAQEYFAPNILPYYSTVVQEESSDG